MIETREISFAVKQSKLVNNISLSVTEGEFVVIMGANGAGKSTLLKMLSGALQPATGEIFFKNKPIATYPKEALARHRAVLSQHYHISFPMLAREIVMMGRYPYFDHQPTAADEAIVQLAMERMQVWDFAERDYTTLSGGEAQKVQMSRVLAQIGDIDSQNSKMLLLDEPVSHLDVKYQHQLLQEAKLLCIRNMAVVAVLHDINLAMKYADRILFMKQGNLVQSVSKRETVSSGLLKEVFDVDAAVYDMPGGVGKFVAF